MPPARPTIAALLLTAMAAASAASAAPAATPLPNIDSRARDSGPVTPDAEQARRALSRRLGDEGAVRTDRVSGAARLVARTDGMLTARSGDDPAEVALGYVRAQAAVFGLDGGDLSRLRLTSRYRSPDGVTHLAWTQTYDGIAAYDNVLYASVARDGRLVNVGGSAVAGLAVGTTVPAIGAAQALAAARGDVGGPATAPRATQEPGAERATRFSSGDLARLTIFSDGRTERLAWRVQVSGEDEVLYEVVVDAASADVLKRRSLTQFASMARVYENHPGAPRGGAPVLVDLAADPTWLSLSGNARLRGNNAWAFADADAVDLVEGPSPGDVQIPPNPGTTNWDYPLVPFSVPGQTCPAPGCTWNSGDPTTRVTNRNQATTQLFWFVNTFHDHLKRPPIGFTHAARGFEHADADGPSGPGLGGDALLAETDNYDNPQTERPTRNNATMSTPPDGTSPWMETFLFTDPSLNAAHAADIVYHEYTHGLTNRSVGSGAGLDAPQSLALGEGWSDWYALDFLVAAGHVADTQADGELSVGAYLLNAFGTPGFRRQGLDCPVGSTSPACPGTRGAGPGGFTLGDIGRVGREFQVHDDGEIWGETLWDLRRALGSHTARALITVGLRLAPDNPSFIEARDAILQADQATAGGANHAVLWQVFAGRGMGYSASTPSSAAVSASEAFDLPPAPARPAPEPPPPPPPPPPPMPVPPQPPAATPRAPAKLAVLRAGVKAGRLDVFARITARAAGRVAVSYRSSGRITRFTVPIARGEIRISRLLPAAQRRKSTGIVTLVYDGSATVQPDDVTLRAATGKALLVRRTTRIDDRGRLRVSGSITRRARGVVRIRLGYVTAGGSVEFLRFRAQIRRGAWSLAAPLPREAAQAGGQLSIQFTGYEPRLIRGEQLAKAVAPR